LIPEKEKEQQELHALKSQYLLQSMQKIITYSLLKLKKRKD
jgi:hypothetical protein